VYIGAGGKIILNYFNNRPWQYRFFANQSKIPAVIMSGWHRNYRTSRPASSARSQYCPPFRELLFDAVDLKVMLSMWIFFREDVFGKNNREKSIIRS